MILDCEMRKSASFEASLGTFMEEFRPIGAQQSDEEDWLENSKHDFSRNIMTKSHLQQNGANHYSFSCHVSDCQEGRASYIHQNRLVEAKAYIFNPSSGSLCLRERWRDSWIDEHVMSIYIFSMQWHGADVLNSGAEIRFI